jgi:hypothetical protein
MRDPPNDWLTWLIVHMPRRVLERRGVTYGITLTNKRAPMADQPEVLLRLFSMTREQLRELKRSLSKLSPHSVRGNYQNC